MRFATTIALGVFAALAALLYPPLTHRAIVFGLTRPLSSFQNIHGEGLRSIPNTVQCEDLHLHGASGLLFAACEGSNPHNRRLWFPPLSNFIDPSAAGQGSLYVINPETFKSTRLTLTGFTGPFVTHGIDLYSSVEEPDSVYIFAVNHVPNAAYGPSNPHEPKAKSQIELFRHEIGTLQAVHIRSIQHPLIQTPNDLYATSPTSFYVTNDHYYREGLLRTIEDLATQQLAPWTNTVFVEFVPDRSPNSSVGVQAAVALTSLHNNNGLGHSSTARPDEILIGDASGGVLSRTKRVIGSGSNPNLKVLEQIYLDSTIDNPSFYDDPYPEVGGDASGYIVAGLGRAVDLGHTHLSEDGRDPVIVWHVRPNGNTGDWHDRWEKRVIFQDDGKMIRTASAAVLLPIDPAKNGGKKQGLLFVTGFMSDAMISTKIDL